MTNIPEEKKAPQVRSDADAANKKLREKVRAEVNANTPVTQDDVNRIRGQGVQSGMGHVELENLTAKAKSRMESNTDSGIEEAAYKEVQESNQAEANADTALPRDDVNRIPGEAEPAGTMHVEQGDFASKLKIRREGMMSQKPEIKNADPTHK